MNKELALRTFAYLIGHYKTHNATIINKQEIEAIEFFNPTNGESSTFNMIIEKEND